MQNLRTSVDAALAIKDVDEASSAVIQAESEATQSLLSIRRRFRVARPNGVGLSKQLRRDWDASTTETQRLESKVSLLAMKTLCQQNWLCQESRDRRQMLPSGVPPLEPTNPEGQSGIGNAVDPSPLVPEAGATPIESTTDAPPSKRDHALDGKTVIDVFARIGVVCAVVRPTKEELEGLTDFVMNVGANADVIILDWVLHDSRFGERTLELIQRIVASSVAESGRARLIVVYTAEPKLVDIERGIRKHLNLEEENPSDSLTITSGGTRICVYGKAGIRPAPLR